MPGKITLKQKFQKGEVVLYDGNKVKINEVSFMARPDAYGSKAKPQHMYKITDKGFEQVLEMDNKWVKESSLRKVK